MTKREPFARTVEDEGDVWVCVGQQIVNQFAQGEGLVFANNLVRALNAAHEARVKEEVRKAVSDFKSEALSAIASVPGADSCCGYFLNKAYKAVLAIPTKTEDKK